MNGLIYIKVSWPIFCAIFKRQWESLKDVEWGRSTTTAKITIDHQRLKPKLWWLTGPKNPEVPCALTSCYRSDTWQGPYRDWGQGTSPWVTGLFCSWRWGQRRWPPGSRRWRHYSSCLLIGCRGPSTAAITILIGRSNQPKSINNNDKRECNN